MRTYEGVLHAAIEEFARIRQIISPRHAMSVGESPLSQKRIECHWDETTAYCRPENKVSMGSEI